MKRYSKKWMGTFLEKPLPDNQTILDTMSRKAFEVESIEEVKDADGSVDSLFEIKVLPNRVADAMNLYGMAKEMSALFEIKVKAPLWENINLGDYKLNNDFVEINDKAEVNEKGVEVRANKPVLCFTGLKVKFDNSIETPEWIKDILVKSGGRSINCLVDITNLLLFSFGQPAHVFDATKLNGKIVTRFAQEGEELELLDGKKVKLVETDYLIADEKHGLSVAGIKGGKLAEVDKNTTEAVFEMANFNPSMIRKTSTRLALRTDASKIFENGISTTVTQNALKILIATIKEIDPSCEIEFYFQHNLVTKKGFKLGLYLESINNYAGKEFTTEEVLNLLARQNFKGEYITIGRKLEEVIKKLKELNETEKLIYKLGASVSGDAPQTVDCSSLVSYLFKEAGVQIPRTTVDQLVFGKEIHETDLSFGDLVFSNSGRGHIWYKTLESNSEKEIKSGVDHVGMYLNDGSILYVQKDTEGLVIEKLEDSPKFQKENVVGYRRVCNLADQLFVVTPPDERLDIKIEEDLLEEILRIYGFDNLSSKPLNIEKKINHNTRFLFENYLKLKLINKGYTEIFNYTFVDKGNVKVKLGLASDKEYLRNNLSDGAVESFTKNYNYLPILEQNILKYFEIGTVFLDDNTEEKRCVIVCDDNKKKTTFAQQILDILKEVESELGLNEIEIITSNEKPAIVEFSVDKIVKEIDSKKIILNYTEIDKDLQTIKYKPISVYPFILRDIAMFVSSGFDFENLKSNLLKLNLQNVEKVYMFDSFTKKLEGGEEKTSIAFRLIFQSYTETLTDEVVEKEMQKVNTFLLQNSYEIR